MSRPAQTMLLAVTLAPALAAGVSSTTNAQSFNVDVGLPGAGVPETYAGAGAPGHWMSIPCTQGVTVSNLVDIDGQVTNVRLSQFGGTETVLLHDNDMTGPDATLMNDCLVTHTAIENCIFFDGLVPGTYDVIVYARMPGEPEISAVTNCDQEPGNPHHTVGGEWPGVHELYVSYAHHVAVVPSSGTWANKLWLHSGVPAGGDLAIGAALNGFQIHKRPACPEDLDDSGTIDVQDLVAIVLAWGRCAPFCPADVNGDGGVDVGDLVAVILAWGECP